MQSNFNAALQHVLKSEGGFVNHPADPGGMTNLGVTARTWGDWIGHTPSEKEMRELTPEKVSPLYKRKFWEAVKGDDLPAGIDYCLFDIAVNSGPGRAVKFLQQCVGVTPDGGLGPKTMEAVTRYLSGDGAKSLINNVCDKRQEFWQSLPTFGTFGKGWTARGEHVRQGALSMVS